MKKIIIAVAAVAVTAAALAATTTATTVPQSSVVQNPGIVTFAKGDGFSGNLQVNTGDGLKTQSFSTPGYEINPILTGSYGFGNGWVVYGKMSLDYLKAGNSSRTSYNYTTHNNSYTGNNSYYSYNNNYGVGVQYTMDPSMQFGLETNYLNWRTYTSDQAGPGKGLVTGFELMPYMQFESGKNCLYVEADYKQIGSGDYSTSASKGTLEYINPQYSYKVSKNLTFGATAKWQTSTGTYQELSNYVNNGDSDKIEIKPFTVSYAVPEVKGLDIGFETKYEGNDYKKNMIGVGSNHGYYTTITLTPEVSYTYDVTPDFSLSAGAKLDIKHNIQKASKVRQDGNTFNAAQYEGKITLGADYTF